MRTFGKGRLIAGCVIGAFSGFMLLPTLMLSAWVLPIPILIAFLWVWSGWPAALIAAASVEFAGFVLYGWPMALGLMMATVLPGVGAAWFTELRKPFFKATAYSIAFQWAMLILVMAGARLAFQADLVDVLTTSMQGMLESLPGSLQRSIVLRLGQFGLFGSSTGIDFFSASLTNTQLRGLIQQFIHSTNESLKLMLPAYVLTSGGVTGALSYGVSALVRVRRGDDPPIPYVKPEGWRLTPNLIVGPPVLALVLFILDQSGMAGADAAYVAITSVARLLFEVQAIGAIDRKLKKAGMTPGKRSALIVAALLLMQTLMSLVGIYSALFGSKGLISEQFRKRMDGKGDE